MENAEDEDAEDYNELYFLLSRPLAEWSSYSPLDLEGRIRAQLQAGHISPRSSNTLGCELTKFEAELSTVTLVYNLRWVLWDCSHYTYNVYNNFKDSISLLHKERSCGGAVQYIMKMRYI